MADEELVGPVPDGWQYTTLGIACERGGGDIQTGPFGSQLHAADYVPVGIPSIMPQNIGDNRIVEDGIARITAEDAKRLGRYLVRRGDIVYSRRGDVERRALVCDREHGWLCGTGCLRVRLGDKGPDPRFATYYLGHPSVREWIVRHAHGATMPNLNTSILGACPFVIPPPAEQRAIAHILGTLDDSVELNRRMSETLGAMARALFKSWFVDFEPVRAKAEGRDPGLPKLLADLFPDSFVDSELGETPKGWEVTSVAAVCDTVTRGVTPAYEEGTRRYIINQRVNRGPWLDWSELKELSTALIVPADRYAKPWDVLVNCLGEGTLGRTHLFLGKSDLYAVDQHMSICRATSPSAGAYLYQVLASPWGQEKIESLKTGSTGMTMFNISKLRDFELLWPKRPLTDEYFRVVEPALIRTALNEAQSRTLASLRDTLLPKLISGELRVKDPDRFLAGAA